jgi:hypothetical protein
MRATLDRETSYSRATDGTLEPLASSVSISPTSGFAQIEHLEVIP